MDISFVDRNDPDWADRLTALDRVADAIAGAIAADNGVFTLHGVTADGVVHCEISGACGSCAVATVSTAAGLERILTERFDWVSSVQVAVAGSEVEGTGGWVPQTTPVGWPT